MSQKLADQLKDEFTNMTNIQCEAVFMEKGESHKPTTLLASKKGVYVFLLDDSTCFKVGKAGSKSPARWNSHHYNLDQSTPSAFTKSILKNLEHFKSFFDESLHNEIDEFEKNKNTKDWIQNNISRIEFKISSSQSDIALNLLEALIQFRLNPMYEGKTA